MGEKGEEIKTNRRKEGKKKERNEQGRERDQSRGGEETSEGEAVTDLEFLPKRSGLLGWKV